MIARPHLDDREHLFILVGRRVVSASQHFVTQFQLYTDATFVGEPTSSRPNFFGAQRFFELPNSKLQMRSSVIFHQDASGWEMDGTTHPDYLVEPSGADFAANRDPVLELVLDFDRYADLPQRCEDAMTEAYLAGDVAAMERAYTSFLREHADGHLDEHALLGDFTWWMFENRRDLTEYGEFLEMYTRRCPDSSGAWYSLGIRRRNAGDPQAALRCLERSIEAYPGNGPAKRERDLLVFDMERGER